MLVNPKVEVWADCFREASDVVRLFILSLESQPPLNGRDVRLHIEHIEAPVLTNWGAVARARVDFTSYSRRTAKFAIYSNDEYRVSMSLLLSDLDRVATNLNGNNKNFEPVISELKSSSNYLDLSNDAINILKHSRKLISVLYSAIILHNNEISETNYGFALSLLSDLIVLDKTANSKNLKAYGGSLKYLIKNKR